MPDVEVVAAGAGDDRVDDGGCSAAAGAAEKHPILTARRDGFHFAFDGVVVDGQAAVVNEPAQLRPLVQDVADGLADFRLRQDILFFLFEEQTQA